MRIWTAIGLSGLAWSCTQIGNEDPVLHGVAPMTEQAPPALHGAAPMAEQVERASTLAGKVDPMVAPTWVDPVIWQASIPADNLPAPARVALGKKLFFDLRLSRDRTVACATCHDVTRSFADLRPVSEGIGEQLGHRNAPTVMNAALLASQFWDGRAAQLEDQAVLPIVNPIEMGMPTGEAAVAAIAGDAEYEAMFQAAYERPPGYADLGRAIASFERTLMFLDAPFDRWVHGHPGAISEQAKLGFVLYNGKGRCAECHPLNAASPLGSDGRFHNVGVSARHQDFAGLVVRALAVLARDGSMANIDQLAVGGDTSELGRFVVTRIEADIGGFRTPQIRNAGVTAPYMHDGSMQTLWDVMDHYNRGGEANPYLDGGIEPLALTEDEIDQLVAFVFTLTDDRFAAANRRAFEAQRARARIQRPFREDDLAMRRRLPFEPAPEQKP